MGVKSTFDPPTLLRSDSAATQRRAGTSPKPELFKPFIKTVFQSPVISVYGFYSHAGDSYGSTSVEQAETYLTGEVRLVNDIAAMALEVLADLPRRVSGNGPFVLSVGSTPAAHSASAKAKVTSQLHGVLELHAGRLNQRVLVRGSRLNPH